MNILYGPTNMDGVTFFRSKRKTPFEEFMRIIDALRLGVMVSTDRFQCGHHEKPTPVPIVLQDQKLSPRPVQ